MRPDVAARLEQLTGAPPSQVTAIGGGHGAAHYRVTLADGRVAFVKAGAESPPVLAAEAAGLRWLAAANAIPVPGVLGCSGGLLVTSWITPEQPTRQAAAAFGRDLARLHAAGPVRLGAPWPGYLAGLPLDNTSASDGECASNSDSAAERATASTATASTATASTATASTATASTATASTATASTATASTADWPHWYASHRLLPFARRAKDAGQLGTADVRLIEAVAARLPALAGPAEPPSRIHGDCWSGNVLWSGGRGVLIDPAAHGGHRETDLAMLALFGAPFLDQITAAYTETAPLAAGWQARVPLHQLHPLLVHVCLFGAAYRDAALAAARAALAA